MNAGVAAVISAAVGAALGLLVGALLGAVRSAALVERIEWLQWLNEERDRAEQDEIVAEFRARLDEWDEG